MKIWQKILILLGICLAILFIANLPYFSVQVKTTFYGIPSVKESSQNSPVEILPADFLEIDSLGIKVPIQYPAQKTEKAFQEALISGVAHFPETSGPGELGNCYIFGHSSDYIWSKGKYKTAFTLLPNIKKGAEIKITNALGQEFKYIVTNAFVAKSTDTYLLDQGGYRKKVLTLQTSYPIGTALKRYIVQAEIIQ